MLFDYCVCLLIGVVVWCSVNCYSVCSWVNYVLLYNESCSIPVIQCLSTSQATVIEFACFWLERFTNWVTGGGTGVCFLPGRRLDVIHAVFSTLVSHALSREGALVVPIMTHPSTRFCLMLTIRARTSGCGLNWFTENRWSWSAASSALILFKSFTSR